MKISQMSTEKAAGVLVRIMEPVTHIIADQEAMQIVSSMAGVANSIEGVMAILMKLVPYCLEKHKSDTFAIVAALTDKTEKAVAKQNFLVTVKDIRDSVDTDLVDFFKSFAGAETASETESSD